MTEFQFQNSVPDGWDDLCNRHAAFFGTTFWQSFLESSFRCRTIFGTNDAQGVAITIFKAGPFEVGYLGFPAGTTVGQVIDLRALLNDFLKSNLGGKPVCVRMSPSSFSQSADLDLKCVRNPETAITDLQDWDCMSVSKKLRRDIRKAEKSGLNPVEVSDPAQGDAIYRMYEDTVRRHQGSMRYTREYFEGLIRLSLNNERVRIIGVSTEDRLAGFAVTIRDKDTSYYLHGGTDPTLRHLCISDLLIRDVTGLAQSDGSDCFNFMASPQDQPMLVRFKEKWGATTRQLKTYTLPSGPLYPAFALAESVYRIFR